LEKHVDFGPGHHFCRTGPFPGRRPSSPPMAIPNIISILFSFPLSPPSQCHFYIDLCPNRLAIGEKEREIWLPLPPPLPPPPPPPLQVKASKSPLSFHSSLRGSFPDIKAISDAPHRSSAAVAAAASASDARDQDLCGLDGLHHWRTGGHPSSFFLPSFLW
jgi:hypothetical protein